MEFQQTQEKRTFVSKFRSFILECRRVFTVTKKPTKEELKIIVKVSGIGMLIIGLLGFIIQMIWQIIK
ncbi:protein translocase SEC61 complex subunit gamma [Candidatus Woesearchaeota archaeon]|nr:protein translocase SEC61 complex subunit gamma [Candidatus Woesearchaeota archaeon]